MSFLNWRRILNCPDLLFVELKNDIVFLNFSETLFVGLKIDIVFLNTHVALRFTSQCHVKLQCVAFCCCVLLHPRDWLKRGDKGSTETFSFCQISRDEMLNINSNNNNNNFENIDFLQAETGKMI